MIQAGPQAFPRVAQRHFDIHTSVGRALGSTREEFGSRGARVVHELPHSLPLRLAYMQVGCGCVLSCVGAGSGAVRCWSRSGHAVCGCVCGSVGVGPPPAFGGVFVCECFSCVAVTARWVRTADQGLAGPRLDAVCGGHTLFGANSAGLSGAVHAQWRQAGWGCGLGCDSVLGGLEAGQQEAWPERGWYRRRR